MIDRGRGVADIVRDARGRVTHRQVAELLSGEAAGEQVLEAFLLACGVSRADHEPWMTRYRLAQNAAKTGANTGPRGYSQFAGHASIPRGAPENGSAGVDFAANSTDKTRHTGLWIGIASLVVAILGLGIGLWAGIPDWKGLVAPEEVNKSGPGITVNGGENGPICNIVGDNNTGNCNEQSIADFKLHDETAFWVYFDGLPDELPKNPPSYTTTSYPCGEWMDWLRGNPRIYFVDLGQRLQLTAGNPDLVTLSDMRVDTIGTVREARDGTWIRCGFGGGSHARYQIRYSTLRPEDGAQVRTAVRDEPGSYSAWVPLRDSTVMLDGVQQADIALHVESAPGKLYSGFATVDVRLNGKTEPVRLGTAEMPYRWIGDGANLVPNDSEMYAYNQAQGAWIKGFNPMDGTVGS